MKAIDNETEIKEEELDLLKLSEQGGEKEKKQIQMIYSATNANSKMDDLLKKRVRQRLKDRG